MNLLPVGIHFGISREAYKADPGYNQSALKKFGFSNSPAHYRYAEDKPPEKEPDYLRIGRYVDTAIFYPDFLNQEFITWTGGRRYGKAWDEFEAQHAGKTILNQDEKTRGDGTIAAMLAHPDASGALKCSHRQVVIIAEHPLGYRLKGMLDLYPKEHLDWIWDWKTGADASAAFFHGQAHDKGYAIQAAFYMGLLEYIGKPVNNFGFFVGETSPHHGVDTHYFERGQEELLVANRQIEKWLPAYQKCVTENKWPSYDTSWKKIRFRPYQNAEKQAPEVLV